MRSLLLVLLVISSAAVHAADTITVRTLTFDDITKRSGTWLFPPPQSYEKVIMEYTLKCDPRTTQDRFDCGEWDYLTYNFITDSTGQFDSTRREQVNFRVRNATPDSFAYTTVAPASKRRFRTELFQRQGAPANVVAIGTATTNLSGLLTPTGNRGRWVWRAQELLDAGLEAGPIAAMRLTARSAGSIELLSVVMSNMSNATITPPLRTAEGTEVIRRPITLTENDNLLSFSKTFTWDGTSDVVVDIACTGASAPITIGASTAAVAGVMADDSRWAYAFTQGDFIELPADVGNSIRNEVTVAFWAWGDPAKLPRVHSVFEAYDNRGRRVMNVHLPWDNNNVYWDAGRDADNGNFDRIELAAPADATRGRWNHWAFVKNATTGQMRIYLNGEVFHEGSGMRRAMDGIARFIIGAGGAGSYEGLLDEIQVYNAALDQATIRSTMHRRVGDAHPNFNNLLALYSAETDNNPAIARDAAARGNNGTLMGMPQRRQLRMNLLGHLTQNAGGRPAIALEPGSSRGTATQGHVDVDETPRRVSLIRFNRPVEPRIYRHDAPDHPGVATDTLTVFAAGWMPILDETDLQRDSIRVEPTTTLRRLVREWFDPVVEFEIGRFITPYGIGLDLGPNGFKWIYDVTDYAPLLRNNVTLSAGNQQELIDVTFRFITGTPPRPVRQIKQIYSQRDGSYAQIAAGTLLTPTQVTLANGTEQWRVRTRTTGHRFGEPSNCAEFCQRLHHVSVNGQKSFEWLLWDECGNNPVYPQGGTWQLDRAGWCPGAPVNVFDWEFTSLLPQGARTVTLDYGVESDQWNASQGVWDVTMQMLGYGPTSFRNDVAVADIISPSRWEFYSRLNPICGDPVVIIRNTGSQTLTRCTITYGVDDGVSGTFAWTGSLAFMESDTVSLPQLDWGFTEGSRTFRVTVSAPNGVEDEYAQNDAMTSVFEMPPTFYKDFTLNLRTNKQAQQQGFAWYLRKIGGAEIASGRNLESERLYEQTYRLEPGCYEFQLVNPSGYGLDLWFVRQQLGSGSLEFRSRDVSLKRFNADFGTTAWMQFRVAALPTIVTNVDTLDLGNVKPGDTLRGRVVIRPEDEAGLRVTSARVSSLRNVFTLVRTEPAIPTGGLDLAQDDSLVVHVAYTRADAGKNTGTLIVESNDMRTSSKAVRLLGSAGDVSSVIHQATPSYIGIDVIPHPVRGAAEVVITPTDAPSSPIRVQLIDAVGRVVAVLYNGVIEGGVLRLPIDESVASGTYLLSVDAGALVQTQTIVVAR